MSVKSHIASAIKGWAGEAPIDLAIRQAIRLCSMMLPKEKRTVEHVTEIMEHLLHRGLDDLHKNAKAYGLAESPRTHEGGDVGDEAHAAEGHDAQHPHEAEHAARGGDHGAAHEGEAHAEVEVAEVVSAEEAAQAPHPSEHVAASPAHPAPAHPAAAQPPQPAPAHPAPPPAAAHPAPHAPAAGTPVYVAPRGTPVRGPAPAPPVRGPQPAPGRPRLPGDRPPRRF